MPKHLDVFGTATSPFGFPLEEDEARNLDHLLEKAEDDFVYFRCSSAEVEYPLEKERSEVSVITDDSVDQTKEVMDLESIDWSYFRKSPNVAYGHNYTIPPIGKSAWQKRVGNRIKAKTIYASRPKDYPEDKPWFPDTIYHLVAKGFLPGKSIGGVAKKRRITDEDLQKNPHWAGAEIVRYDSKIYEYSVAPNQINKNAIVESITKGEVSIDDELLHKAFPEIADMIEDYEKNNHVPLIKDYMSITQYNENLTTRLEIDLQNVLERTPELVDKVIRRLLGKV